MIKAADAIRVAREQLGTPYGTRPGELDCINLIKLVIRSAQGGVKGYTTAGSNSLWRSYDSASKYKDLTWRQESIAGAKPGMLAFKIDGSDVHHVGLVTERGTVVHASSAKGETVETPLDKSWHALAIHRYIQTTAEEALPMYKAEVNLISTKSSLNLRNGPSTTDRVIGKIPFGAVVDVLAEKDSWLYVRYNGMSGYAAAEYLVRVGEDEPDVDEPADAGKDIHVFTTLMNEDGVAIRLEGRWRVAED